MKLPVYVLLLGLLMLAGGVRGQGGAPAVLSVFVPERSAAAFSEAVAPGQPIDESLAAVPAYAFQQAVLGQLGAMRTRVGDAALQHPLRAGLAEMRPEGWRMAGRFTLPNGYFVAGFVRDETDTTMSFRSSIALIAYYRADGVLFDALLVPTAQGGADGVLRAEITLGPGGRLVIQTGYNGCGQSVVEECSYDCAEDVFEIQGQSPHYERTGSSLCAFGGFYQDVASGEVMYFLSSHNAPIGVVVMYRSGLGNSICTDLQDDLGQNYTKWKRLTIKSADFTQRKAVVQFPGSPTLYTLNFSPGFGSLTSRGSDGSAVQTFRLCHMP